MGLEEEGDDMGELWEEAMSQLAKWATKRNAASTRVGPAATEEEEEEEEVAAAPPKKKKKYNDHPICRHGICRSSCRHCTPSLLCVHDKYRIACRICMPGSFCTHGRRRGQCRECGAALFCFHGINRYRCIECDGRLLCATPGCTTCVLRAGDTCKTCVPSPAVNARVVEIQIAGVLHKWFDMGKLPMTYTTWNKQVASADPVQCGRFRPDFVYEINDEQRVVIVEVDEHAHKHYDRRCELVRQAEVASSFGGRPVILIRFNPDALTSEPWIKAIPAKERRALLLECLKQALAPGQPVRFDNHLTVHYLFYPPLDALTEPTPQQTFTFARVQPDYEAWAERMLA